MNKKDKFYVMRDYTLNSGLLSLIHFINEVNSTKDMDMIEIGSYTGDSTLLFAEHFNTVTAIDPFLDDYDPNDDACNYAPFEQVYNEFLRRTKEVSNITLIRQLSDDAVKEFSEPVDFIYIDGMHTYEQVKKDIKNYLPLVKNGGFISGHDYVPGFQGVMDAVNEEFGSPDMTFQDTSWIKRV